MPQIGIDLGGTKIESVLLADDLVSTVPVDATVPGGSVGSVGSVAIGERVVLRRRTPTPAGDGYAAIVASLVEHVEHLEREAGEPCTVGLGTPGAVSGREGRIKNSNTACLRGRPIGRDLSESLGREVRVENDANCFALAEATAGAARGKGVVFGVILGTGVGGGIVIGGRVHRGLQGIAGEWGHSPIGCDGPACYCGQSGCVETRLSGPALERSYRERGGEPQQRAADIFRLAAEGDGIASAVVEEYLAYFGEGIARVIHVLDPDAVVLGGGLSNAEVLYSAGRRAVESVLFNETLETPILPNQLGDSAGVLGAAGLWSPGE